LARTKKAHPWAQLQQIMSEKLEGKTPSDATPCSASPSDLLPPREIIEAAATVAMWMEKMGYRNWQLGGVCDRRFAAKCPDAEEMRKGLWPIRQAQTMLEDNYPKWNEAGQAHAITSACEYLRDAHNRISHLYAALIGLPNDKDLARRTQDSE
jgi:hypothetical protein